MENSTISMAIFNSYVKLPEGISDSFIPVETPKLMGHDGQTVLIHSAKASKAKSSTVLHWSPPQPQVLEESM